MADWESIDAAIGAAEGGAFHARERSPVGGGCINEAWRIEGHRARYFVKLNRAVSSPMFAAEAAGLEALAASHSVRVPRVVCHGTADADAFLVLEFLDLGAPTRNAEVRLGHDLALLHGCHAEHFGWACDNTIGSTPQPNGWRDDWVEFWREQRLGHQLRLAASRGMQFRHAERLLADLDRLLGGRAPRPSLLHGDLWGGNWATISGGTPVLFDPAVYHGDRETDIAMTELFGGFGAAFHAAYREAAPLADGYRQRRDIYNLYHVLNHANLFGGSYAGQAQRTIDRILADG